jgi:hypothetical protein
VPRLLRPHRPGVVVQAADHAELLVPERGRGEEAGWAGGRGERAMGGSQQAAAAAAQATSAGSGGQDAARTSWRRPWACGPSCRAACTARPAPAAAPPSRRARPRPRSAWRRAPSMPRQSRCQSLRGQEAGVGARRVQLLGPVGPVGPVQAGELRSALPGPLPAGERREARQPRRRRPSRPPPTGLGGHLLHRRAVPIVGGFEEVRGVEGAQPGGAGGQHAPAEHHLADVRQAAALQGRGGGGWAPAAAQQVACLEHGTNGGWPARQSTLLQLFRPLAPPRPPSPPSAP